MTKVFSASDKLAMRMFPISRQQYTLRAVDEALAACGDERLRRKVARALELGDQARSLELNFRGYARQEFGDDARQLDIELDRALGALFHFLTATVKSFGDDSPQGSKAQTVIEWLFPRGLRYVIQLPYVAQASTVRLMLKWARSEPPLIEALRDVHADPLVERVAQLHTRFAAALPKTASPTYADVRQARREGHERLCAIVFLIGAALLGDDLPEEQAEALRKALAEVDAQDAAIKRYYRRHRRVTDVDPETGEELESEEELDEEAHQAASPFTAADVAEASPPAAEAIEHLGERVADPWSPGEEGDMHTNVA